MLRAEYTHFTTHHDFPFSKALTVKFLIISRSDWRNYTIIWKKECLRQPVTLLFAYFFFTYFSFLGLLKSVMECKLRYFGHVMRCSGECLKKMIMQGCIEGQRPRGRPGFRTYWKQQDARLVSCYEKRNTEMIGQNWSIQHPTIRTDDGLQRRDIWGQPRLWTGGMSPDTSQKLCFGDLIIIQACFWQHKCTIDESILTCHPSSSSSSPSSSVYFSQSVLNMCTIKYQLMDYK